MNFDNFEGETELLATPEAEAPPVNIPATAIAAKVRAAKKGKKAKSNMARAVKARTAKKKAAKLAPAKKKATKAKPAAAKGTLTKVGGKAVRPNAVGRTGRKGWAEKDRVRKGDAVFGRKVAKARAAQEWPQWKLAEKVGCTQPAMCNIERGTVNASAALKAKIRKVLGV